MPKKGSTKKDWEIARQKKKEAILKDMSKEQLIDIIQVMFSDEEEVDKLLEYLEKKPSKK